MIKIGDYNKLKILRKTSIGYFLNEKEEMENDILLPFNNTEERELEVSDEVEAFIYKDSKDRPIATLKIPYAKVSDLAYLKVVARSKIGCFLDFGLERDLFVPMKEQCYLMEEGLSYLVYVYEDKTSRLAATTYIEKYLKFDHEYKVGDEKEAIVYGFQTNGSLMIAIDGIYKGVILKNEYFTKVTVGEKLSVRIIKIYEDGKIGATPRKKAVDERKTLEQIIMKYLEEHDGFMEYNDKSSPEDIRLVFKESKNYFKNTLGSLMKKGLIYQDKEGTHIK
ncbi:MAG: S1 RNA-binding domain-containing protein [Clostridiaceae bacterium]